jgi:hypothetical protein
VRFGHCTLEGSKDSHEQTLSIRQHRVERPHQPQKATHFSDRFSNPITGARYGRGHAGSSLSVSALSDKLKPKAAKPGLLFFKGA